MILLQSGCFENCYTYVPIVTDFERAWAQKWVQSFQSLLDRFYKTLQIEKCEPYFAFTGTKPALKGRDG
jgi:hypothetical protein